MRYSTVIKFVAFVLCAATLLGMVGSAVGIVFLTELGSKSVDEAYEDQLESQAISYAMTAGGVYGSGAWGGAPRSIIDQRWSGDWENRYFHWSKVGYTLYDSEGTVLEEKDIADGSVAYELDIPVGGQYIKVLSTTPHEEYYPQETGPAASAGTQVTVMPSQESTAVHSVIVDYTDGHREEWPYDGTQLGILEYTGGSEVTFISNIGELPMGDGWYPTHILFADRGGNIVYEAYDNNVYLGGGTDYNGDNYLIYWLLPAATVTSAAPLGVTFNQGEYTAYDAIPTQGVTVSTMNVTYANAEGEAMGSEGVSSPHLIGTIFHDHQSNAEFHSNEPMTMDIPADAIITDITFADAQQNCIFEASSPGGVGTLYNDENGYLVFKGAMPGTVVPEETIPQETMAEETDIPQSLPVLARANTDINVYYAPATNDAVGTVIKEGQEFEILRLETVEGFQYGYTGQGWVRMYEVTVLNPEAAETPETVETAAEPEGLTGFAREKLNIYSAPSAKSQQVGTVDAWQEVSILKQESFEGKAWGLTTEGWILMENLLLAESAEPAAAASQNIRMAETDIPVYSAPLADVRATIKAGTEYEILEQKEVDGSLWGATDAGWILLEDAAESSIPEITFHMEPITEETEEMVQLPDDAAVAQIPQETVVAVSPDEIDEALTAAEETAIPTEPVMDAADAEDVEIGIYYESDQRMVAEYVMEAIPYGYTMKIRLAEGALRSELSWTLLRLAEAFRSVLLEILGVCIVVFVLCVVHLCCSAGRTRRNNDVMAGGLNRIPLDLYLGGGTVLGMGLVALGMEGSQYFARNDQQLAILLLGACAYLLCLLIVGFFFAFVAQIKTPGGFWWRHSFCGWCVKLLILGCTGAADLCIKFWLWVKPLMGRFFPWLGHTGAALWAAAKKSALWLWDTGKRLCIWLWTMMKQVFQWTTGKLARFFGMLPITWQFLVTGFILVFLLYVMMRTYKVGYILLGFGIFFAVILYAASAFAILLENAKRMSKGDLDTKVDDRMLIGGFKEFAGELNDLAGVAVVAAQKQLKSERMKTELITNVSHDIKTPLTSIINYVDLLQKPHSEQQQEQYLEVLDRQSQRLKKLIDDLMEMSKASTGNLAVDIEQVDAAEAVNQALGEFADKLERAQLTPVFRQPDEQVYMMADGRLVWRVMSNLLGNAVKYALPGTRVYLDLLEMDGKVIISMKNISREELNVNADELLERFVRGDASRNTEGSGLGLNIAQSLMELQRGQLQILVDGDLFKVTLIFPGIL